jgi:hypothetical protein
MRPNGRKQLASIDRPENIERIAATLADRGVTFEAEVLVTNEVSLTAELDDETLAIEVVPNGPQIPEAVDRLVLAADAAKVGG